MIAASGVAAVGLATTLVAAPQCATEAHALWLAPQLSSPFTGEPCQRSARCSP